MFGQPNTETFDRRPLDEWSDSRLLQAVAASDRAAFEVLFRRYHPRLLGFVCRWISSREQAEEVVQEAMFVMWKDAGAFQGRSKVSTWLFGISYRLAMRSLGREEAHRGVAEDQLPERGAEDKQLGNQELRWTLDRALDRLSPEHRAVVELTFFEDCSYREVAAILDCPLNTVKTRMFHAREKLRHILQRLSRPTGIVREAP